MRQRTDGVIDGMIDNVEEAVQDGDRLGVIRTSLLLRTKANELADWLSRAHTQIGPGNGTDEQDALWITRLRLLEGAYDTLSDARRAL